MEFLSYFWAFLLTALALLVLSFIPVVLELWRTVKDFRRIADRIEMLTDIRGWLSFIKAFKSQKKK